MTATIILEDKGLDPIPRELVRELITANSIAPLTLSINGIVVSQNLQLDSSNWSLSCKGNKENHHHSLTITLRQPLPPS